MVESRSTEIPTEPPGGLDARFCEVMDAAPVMIWVSGQEGLCTWFNRPWLTFTGRAMAQELGSGWSENVHRDDLDRCLEIYASHFDDRKEFRMQYRLRRHDGAYRWIDDTGIPRYARDGSFLGYIGSCIDIHDHLETQSELRRRLLEIAHLNRKADAAALAGSIAHELNQPLAAILSNAEAAEVLLAANPLDLDPVKEALADIRRDNYRAAEAIRRMRGLLATTELKFDDFDLNGVISTVRELLAAQAAEMGIALSVDQQQRAFPVRAHAVHLQQVVMNLALNGMDAMLSTEPGRRRMVLQTALAGGTAVEVSISDSGTSIPAETLERVFDPFFTTKHRGAGLGLAIARGIVESYGGRIWAENRPGGGGAVFRFNLPLARSAG